jgi:hypothetical protein
MFENGLFIPVSREITEPISVNKFLALLDSDGCITFSFAIDWDILLNLGGIESLNDWIDWQPFFDPGSIEGLLTDLEYAPIAVRDENILFKLTASTDEIVIYHPDVYICKVCDSWVVTDDLREHLITHNPNARGFDFEDVNKQFEQCVGRSHAI